nr:unnamed protein product [Digitaria exilis]
MAMDDNCKRRFLELKAKRTYRFVVFIEKVGEPNLTYDDFAATLPTDECRYFIYDFVTEEGSPDTVKIRSKMLYASSKDRFRRELDDIQVELQATDPTEMGLDVIRNRAN